MQFTKNKVAQYVQRSLFVPVLGADKKQKKDPVTKVPLVTEVLEDISADEVLDYNLDLRHLTVITADGKKLKAELTPEQLVDLMAEPEPESGDESAPKTDGKSAPKVPSKSPPKA